MSKKSKKRVLKPQKSTSKAPKSKKKHKKKSGPAKKPGKGSKTKPTASKSKKRTTTSSKGSAPIRQKKQPQIIAKPRKNSDIKTKLKYLYASLYSKRPSGARKPNNYNAFQTCLSEYLQSIGREKWGRFGEFKDISRTIWAKYKSYPINRLCQNIDEVFNTEFNEFFPTRKADADCIKTDYSGTEWFNFRDTLYFNLLESQCIKLIDKIYFVGNPELIGTFDISADHRDNSDSLHEALKELFFKRPSPPPLVELLKIEETSRGKLIVYYYIESQYDDVVDISFLKQIEDEDQKEFGPKKQEQKPSEPVVPVHPVALVVPPAEGTRLAELQEERKIAEAKLETEKIQLERERMLMERIKIAQQMGLTGDALLQFINLKG